MIEIPREIIIPTWFAALMAGVVVRALFGFRWGFERCACCGKRMDEHEKEATDGKA
jgi:hypothetical protein